jgi:hypothetical protein
MYIANNEIIISTSSTGYGFYDYSNSAYSRYDFYHNSIYISNSSTAYGLYIYPYSSSYQYNFINNNIYLTTSSTGYLFIWRYYLCRTSYCTVNTIIIINRVVRLLWFFFYSSLSSWQSPIARIIIQPM